MKKFWILDLLKYYEIITKVITEVKKLLARRGRIILRSTELDIQKQPPEVFCKKDVLKNFAKFTGKYLCQSLFFNKVTGLRPTTLLKRDSDTDVLL